MYRFNPSDEQKRVIDLMIEGENVYTEAVPGAGKTTTGLAMGERLRNKEIFYITFSAQLKLEGKEKASRYGLTNVHMFSYHSLAVRYYSGEAHDDRGLTKIVKTDMGFKNEVPKLDILVLDEIQDMTPLFYRFIQKFIKDQGHSIQLLILGDRDQNINRDFKGSDYRFLTMAPKVFPEFEFVRSDLSHSFRLTDNISSFINDNLLGYDKIKTNKKGPTVKYLLTNTFSNEFQSYLYRLIRDKINNGYKYDDIFILGNSVKSELLPIVRFENYLSEHPINGEIVNIYMPRIERMDLRDSDTAEKIVMTTYHQSKGRERKLVIVFGCDEYMFLKGPREMNYDKMPEDYYVALSRATEELIVIHDISMRKLPFLKNTIGDIRQKSYCELIFVPPRYIRTLDLRNLEHKDKINPEKEIRHNTNVTELTQYIKENILEDLSNICDEIFVQKQLSNKRVLKTNIDGRKKKLTEQVSDITGVVIPSIWEYNKTGKMKIYDDICKNINEMSGDLIKIYKSTINYPCQNIQDYLRLGNLYISVVNGCENNLNQIQNFDWLNEEDKNRCLQNLELIISHEKTLKFEYTIEKGLTNNRFTINHERYGKLKIGNRIDLIDDNYVYEFKCTKNLTIEHKLQLLIYAWMINNLDEGNKDYELRTKGFRLFNIVNNEMFELNYNQTKVEEAIELILFNKYCDNVDKTDEEFIKFINA